MSLQFPVGGEKKISINFPFILLTTSVPLYGQTAIVTLTTCIIIWQLWLSLKRGPSWWLLNMAQSPMKPPMSYHIQQSWSKCILRRAVHGKVKRERVSHHQGTKVAGHYRFEMCFCQPSLSLCKTSFVLLPGVTPAQAAMTDTVKQPCTAKPFKDQPISPRLAPRSRCFSKPSRPEGWPDWRSPYLSLLTLPYNRRCGARIIITFHLPESSDSS